LYLSQVLPEPGQVESVVRKNGRQVRLDLAG
jgi:hypothetical protein